MGLHKPPTRRELEEQRDDALRNYEIAMRTYAAGLPVDWEYSCFRMACALAPGGDAGGFEALSAALDQLGEPPEVLPHEPAKRVKYTRHP